MHPGLCPICQHHPVRPLAANCGHVCCGACIGAYVWRDTCSGHPTACPVCRQYITACTSDPSTACSYWAKLKVGKVAYNVDVHSSKETCLARLSGILGIPASRVKLIRKGKVLHTEDEVREACMRGMQLLAVGSKADRGVFRIRLLWWLEYIKAVVLAFAASIANSHIVRASHLFIVSLFRPADSSGGAQGPHHE